MSTIDIPSYLKSKGIAFRQANGANISMPCFFHGEEKESRGRLYVSTDLDQPVIGLFTCFVCGESGGYNKIRRHFGDDPIRNTNPEKSEQDLPDDTLMGIYNTATNYYQNCLTENEDAFKYLRYERGLDVNTIMKFRLGYSDGALLTHLVSEGYALEDIKRTGLVDRFGGDTFKGMITIPYLFMGNVVTMRGKDMLAKYYSLSGDQGKAQLFNVDCLVEADKGAVVCEGEFDAMTLSQLGFAAVGLPGANSFQEAWVDHFSEVRRVYVCLDNDKAGRAGAEKVSSKLGQKTRIVEMPEGVDINEWVVKHGKSKDDFDFLFARSVGGMLITVDQAFDRWLELEGNPDLQGIRYNVGLIDEQMRHGLLPGQVITLIAKTNSGKTILSLNLFHRMSLLKPDIKILFVSLEQTRNEWFERARRIHSFYDEWSENPDTLNYWRDKLVLIDKNRVTEEELVGALEQYEFEHGCMPDFICIDYLGYYSRSYKGEAYERTTAAIMSLKAIAKEKQVIIYCPHQVNRTGSFGKELSADMAKESGAVEETSDMLMAIWNPDQQPGKSIHDATGEVHMKVLKSRDGPVGQEVVFQFCPRTLALIPTDDKLIHRARRERDYARHGDTWERAIYRMRSGDENWNVGDDEVARYLAEVRRPG